MYNQRAGHNHNYTVTGEYVSVGKNLVGKTVSAVIEKVICIDENCKEENIRLKKEIYE